MSDFIMDDEKYFYISEETIWINVEDKPSYSHYYMTNDQDGLE